MNKKPYIAPEIAEEIISDKLMLSIASGDAQEVLSRRRDNSFELEEDEYGNEW